MEKNAVSKEELELRKKRVRFRLFVLLIVIDIALVAYLVYEMIRIFTKQ